MGPFSHVQGQRFLQGHLCGEIEAECSAAQVYMALPAEPLPFDQWNSNSNTDWTATKVYINQGDDVEEDDGSEEQTEEESE